LTAVAPTDANTPKLKELRRRIYELDQRLDGPGEAPPHIAELVHTTNILRTNEYLMEKDEIKTSLIACYKEYVEDLEPLIKSILGLQSEMLEVLRMQPAKRPYNRRNTVGSKTTPARRKGSDATEKTAGGDDARSKPEGARDASV